MRVGDPTRAQRGEADGELSNRIRQEAGRIQRNPLVGQANRGMSVILAQGSQAPCGAQCRDKTGSYQVISVPGRA